MAESSHPQTQIPQIFAPIDINELDLEDRNCAICQEPMEEGSEKAIRLPCTHTFGKRCITQWLLEHDSCPQCRRIILPHPQAQPPPPARRFPRHIHGPQYLAMDLHHQRAILVESWRDYRVRLLYRLRANRFTPVTKAIAFVEEQTSTDTTPDAWTRNYCSAIGRTPEMLINGECTARLEIEEILARKIEQQLTDVGLEEEAEEQSREFDHLAKMLRERYIDD